MATVNPAYGASTAITIGLATTPLASSATFVLGRCSLEVDNTSNKYDDAWVQGKVTVGTTPTANTLVNVYVWGADTSTTTLTYGQSNAAGLDTLVGTDADKTLTNTGTLGSFLKLGAVINVIATTSNVTYPIQPFSVAQLFGGNMPKFWGLFVAQNTGAALNATANNQAFAYTGVTYTVV